MIGNELAEGSSYMSIAFLGANAISVLLIIALFRLSVFVGGIANRLVNEAKGGWYSTLSDIEQS
jgi:hypothetical protein